MEFYGIQHARIMVYSMRVYGAAHICARFVAFRRARELLDVRYDKVASEDGFDMSEVGKGDEGRIRHTFSAFFDT